MTHSFDYPPRIVYLKQCPRCKKELDKIIYFSMKATYCRECVKEKAKERQNQMPKMDGMKWGSFRLHPRRREI